MSSAGQDPPENPSPPQSPPSLHDEESVVWQSPLQGENTSPSSWNSPITFPTALGIDIDVNGGVLDSEPHHHRSLSQTHHNNSELMSTTSSQHPSLQGTMSQSLNGPVDFRQLEYVSPYDDQLIDQLMCPICFCPFIEPLRLKCDHIFCMRCVSKALSFQRPEVRNCPTCRSPVASSPNLRMAAPVPKIITRMLENLLVRCPNAKDGCKEAVTRGFVQHHVDHYCQYSKVPCPNYECSKATTRKNAQVGSCLHELTLCQYCGEEMALQDYQAHLAASCPNHKPPLACPGSSYGCPFNTTDEVAFSTHTTTCPIAMMCPFLKSQNDRLEAHEAALKHLQRKNEILEDGLALIEQRLSGSASTLDPAILSQSSSPPLDLDLPLRSSSNTHSPIFSPSSVHFPETSSTPNHNTTNHDFITEPTRTLLSLHESLRDDVSRLTTRVAELDARSTLLLANEATRTRDDFAHATAAINSLRMQLHWVMSSQRFQTATQGHGQTGRASTASTAGGGGVPTTVAGPSSTSAGGVRLGRRLSDSSREGGTKL